MSFLNSGMASCYSMDKDVVKPADYCSEETMDIGKYKKQLKVKIVAYNKNEMEFDLIGIFTTLVNAFRRILLSEVPSMAIEKVEVVKNTSVIADEVLAHRLGLVSLKVNSRLFQFRMPGDLEGTDRDTLNYELKVKCVKNPHRRAGHYLPEDMYLNNFVFSKDIKWQPFGDQKSLYKEEDMGPMCEGIMIAQLMPDQEIHVKMTAVKGIGKDHAKFSPVSTAHYRLLPYIEFLDDIYDEQAERLQKLFDKGVIELVREGNKKKAVLKNTRFDMCNRNVLYFEDLRDKINLGRKRDHFVFSIESVNNCPPDELFRESIKILKKKCSDALTEVKKVSEKSML